MATQCQSRRVSQPHRNGKVRGFCEWSNFRKHLALPLPFGFRMRGSRSLLSLLLVLVTPVSVGADTIIYFFEHPLRSAARWRGVMVLLSDPTLRKNATQQCR